MTTEAGFAALRGGDAQRAWQLFHQAVGETPTDPRAWEGLGLAFCGVGRPADALAALDRALTLAPTNGVLHRHRGTVLEQLQRPAEAVAAYQYALRLNPTDGACLAAIGRLQSAMVPPPYTAPVYPAARAVHAPRDNPGREVAVVVGSVFLAILIGVAGVGYTWSRISARLERMRRSSVSTTPPPSSFGARDWSTRTGPQTYVPPVRPMRPPEMRLPDRPQFRAPEIHIPEPPQIRYREIPVPQPPRTEFPEPRIPQMRNPEPPRIPIPDPPEVRIPEPPQIRVPEPPRFQRPEFPRPPMFRSRFPRGPFGSPEPFPGSTPEPPGSPGDASPPQNPVQQL